ncbi:hypothetical protein DL93DRAFT_1836534 [Clavulina sp. PMI_390]|nr:hypothetical protein DL93DRAFT_1836534 [Clavulina sp. PMI_390]
MNSALDSALSILQGAFSSIVGAPLHEELDYHISKTSPNDRPTRKRDLQAAIADVDETVNSVRAIHDVVTVMLNTLRKKRAAFYHALQSPVHSLPNELLQRIFSELLQEAEGSDIVVALTHVCSSWRSAALGSGRLWEHVKVRTASSLLELVAHSAPHPFSLDLELPLGMSRGLSGSPMIYLLPKDAERLKSLSLGDSSILRRVGFPDSVILFNLQTLRLDAGLSLDFNPIPPLPSTLHSISKLMIHDWDRPRYVMNNSPWPQLTSIYFENSSVTSVARVLDRMAAPCLTNLFFAKMTDGFWTGFFNIMREPPRSIRSMSIIDSNHFIDAFATNFLLLPNLTSLTLVRLADETGCHWETLVSVKSTRAWMQAMT